VLLIKKFDGLRKSLQTSREVFISCIFMCY